MMSENRKQGANGWFCWGIFLSAFLIFQVQPLISKFILPWFGGTPGVWSTCLLFFQTLLFAGYAYAHFSIQRLRPATQVGLHLILLCAAAMCLPITPDSQWKPTGQEDPTWRILCLLTASVGLPYFVLSSTGPLLQAWFGRAQKDVSPYRLYALSNLGSVLGLLSYPFVVEPLWTTETQARIWSVGFISFAVICSACAWRVRRCAPEAEVELSGSPADATQPSRMDRGLWFGLSACASTLLLATTNQVCLDVAVIPFLWVLPLSLYLLSFILVFEHERWYPRGPFAIAFAVSLTLLTMMMYQSQRWPIVLQLSLYFVTMFFCCMVCHGELVKLKPAAKHLTSFYLMTAAGGAMGGLFVGLLAPVLFERLIELRIGLIGCGLFVLVAQWRKALPLVAPGKPLWIATGLAASTIGFLRMLDAQQSATTELAMSRNFFGVLRVIERAADDPENHSRAMLHGQTEHGRQFCAADRRRWPTTYYGEDSGVGVALRHFPRSSSGSMRCGFVGLGVGTLATYGQPGDDFRFYEIDPDVIGLAQTQFSFLSDSAATINVTLGDARLSLEREAPQHLDVLVLDAFSSDAIPVHLLTREAFEIYGKHLKADGVLAIHISNLHFDLRPIVRRLAGEFDFRAEHIPSPRSDERGLLTADWMLLSRNERFWQQSEVVRVLAEQGTSAPSSVGPLWTDQFSDLLHVLR